MRIKELIAASGATQKEIAAALGIAANTFNQYATGRREPDIDTLIRIADFFQVSVDCLLGHDLPANESDSDISVQKRAFAKRLVSARTSAGYSQSTLSGLLNIKQQTLQHWEKGMSFPDCVHVIKLTQLLGVSSDFLLGIHDEKTAASVVQCTASTFSVEAASDLTAFSLDLQARLEALVEALVRKRLQEQNTRPND